MNFSDSVPLFPLGQPQSASPQAFVEGPQMFVSHWMGPIDTSISHTLQGEFKATGSSGESSILFFGVDCAANLPCSDTQMDEMRVRDVDVFCKTDSEARVVGYDSSSSTLQVSPDTASALKQWLPPSTANCKRLIAFFFDGNTNRKPDYVHLHRGKKRGGFHSVDAEKGFIFLNEQEGEKEKSASSSSSDSSAAPGSLKEEQDNNALPSWVVEKMVFNTTVVRNHHSGGTYLFLNHKGDKLESGKWNFFCQRLRGEGLQNDPKKFRVSAKYIRIFILANWGQTEGETLLFRNISFTQSRPYRFLIDGKPKDNPTNVKSKKGEKTKTTSSSCPSSATAKVL